jgi:hypothetical protein
MIDLQNILLLSEKKLKQYNAEEAKHELLAQLYDVAYVDIKQSAGFDGRMVVDIYKKTQEMSDVYLKTPTQDSWHLALFNEFFLHFFQNICLTNEFKNYMESGQLYTHHMNYFSSRVINLYHELYYYELDTVFSNVNTQTNQSFSIQFENSAQKIGELSYFSQFNHFFNEFSKIQKKRFKIKTYNGHGYEWETIKNTLTHIIKKPILIDFYQKHSYSELKSAFDLNSMSQLELVKTFVEKVYANHYNFNEIELKNYHHDIIHLHKENKDMLKQLSKYPEFSLVNLFSHLRDDDYKNVVENLKYSFNGKLVKSLFIDSLEEKDSLNMSKVIQSFEKEVALYLSQKDKYYHYLGLTLEQDNDSLFNLLIKADYKFDILKLNEHTKELLKKDITLNESQNKVFNLYFENEIANHTTNDVLFLAILMDKPKLIQSMEGVFDKIKDNIDMLLPFLKEHILPQTLENNLSYNKVLLENALNSSSTLTKKKNKL